MPASWRPYWAAFSLRFQTMLQYRAAAIAGFATQCWWGGVKVMIFAAFYKASPAAASAPLSLAEAITYTWLSQACFALIPWTGDPDVGLAMRTGSVSHDRLRPVDTYSLWYARAAAWLTARTLPRAGLMLLFAAVLLPLLNLGAWAWRMPTSASAAALFTISIVLAVLLASAVMMLINIVAVATLNDRGVNMLVSGVLVVFSGNLLPLALFPDWLQPALLIQPFAGLLDIPMRLYFGQLSAVALGIQLFWIVAFVCIGRWLMSVTMRRLEVQGG